MRARVREGRGREGGRDGGTDGQKKAARLEGHYHLPSFSHFITSTISRTSTGSTGLSLSLHQWRQYKPLTADPALGVRAHSCSVCQEILKHFLSVA